MISYLKAVLRAYAGGPKHRLRHARLLDDIPGIPEAISRFEQRWPETIGEVSKEAPIFVLASSWRAGSTALQRLVMSGGDAIIWGEPYRNHNLVQRLAVSLRSLSENNPSERELNLIHRDQPLSELWIATFSPSPQHLKAAHRVFLETLLAQPAGELGYRRWGLKEVRLGGQHIAYLRWLFPSARFLLLHRSPYDAYRSYRVFETWYSEWPQRPVLSARDFGRHWACTTRGFLRAAREFPDDVRLLSHADLSNLGERLITEIAGFLGLELRPEALHSVVTGRDRSREEYRPPPSVPRPELRALARIVDDVASPLGYNPPWRQRTP